MKKLLSLLLALMMVFALAACGNTNDPGGEEENTDGENQMTEGEDVENNDETESDLAYVMDKGTIIIGYTVYEPMNYTDEDGNFTGFDTELAQIVFERLGVEAEFQIIDWGTKEIELNAKTIDCIWNGLTIDEERAANMEITVPYVKNAQVVLVREGMEYDGIETLNGLTVVAEQGSAGEDAVKGAEELTDVIFVPKNVQTDCLMEVKAGTADAAILDLTLANTMTGEGTNYDDLIIVDYLDEEDYGVAFRKGSDLCAAVNDIFAELLADGTMAELAEKYTLTLAE